MPSSPTLFTVDIFHAIGKTVTPFSLHNVRGVMLFVTLPLWSSAKRNGHFIPVSSVSAPSRDSQPRHGMSCKINKRRTLHDAGKLVNIVVARMRRHSVKSRSATMMPISCFCLLSHVSSIARRPIFTLHFSSRLTALLSRS